MFASSLGWLLPDIKKLGFLEIWRANCQIVFKLESELCIHDYQLLKQRKVRQCNGF